MSRNAPASDLDAFRAGQGTHISSRQLREVRLAARTATEVNAMM
jgi:hypothetical protein